MSTNTFITKSDYLAFLESPRHLWAIKNAVPQLPYDPLALHQMEDGKRAERLAYDYLVDLVKTRPGCRLLYQQNFEDGPYHTRIDFLIHDTLSNTYDLIEAKSSTGLDKAKHLPDLAFQLAILQKHLEVSRCYVLHLNKDYRRDGELELDKLFILADVTDDVKNTTLDVILDRAQALCVAQLENPTEAEHCYNPRQCPYPGICHPNLPDDSIYNIAYLRANKKRELLDLGVRDINDVPDDFPLNAKQRRIVDCAKNGHIHVEHDELARLFETFEYPLWFLDYESCISAIPLFDGHQPQQQVLFQYSLHKIAKPGADLEHFEFLSFTPGNPYPHLMDSLRHHLGETGTIFAWHKSFESSRNKELAQLFPEHAAFMDSVEARLFDLEDIPKEHIYYHPGFKGRSSIKVVLPTLIPELSYKELPINQGSKASVAWWRMNAGEMDETERVKTQQDLLDYCHLDTLAMVKLFEFFQNVMHSRESGKTS